MGKLTTELHAGNLCQQRVILFSPVQVACALIISHIQSPDFHAVPYLHHYSCQQSDPIQPVFGYFLAKTYPAFPPFPFLPCALFLAMMRMKSYTPQTQRVKRRTKIKRPCAK